MNLALAFHARLRRARRNFDRSLALLKGDFAPFVHGRASDQQADQIRGAQLREIRGYAIGMSAVNVFNAAVLTASLWSTPLRVVAIEWALVVLGLVVGVLVPRTRVRRAGSPGRGSAASTRKVVRNALMLGAVWGALPALMFPGAPESARIVIVCLCAGMLGGGAFALASIPAAAITMMAPIVAGSVTGLTMAGVESPILPIALVGVYCCVLLCGVFQHALDSTGRIISRVEIDRLARRDGMTNLYNNAALRDLIDMAAIRFRRSGEACTLFCVDICRLREINERMGHAVGDELLHQAALRLRGATREIDPVARLDGDLFGVLAVGLGGEATARAYANRILAAFEAPFALPGYEASVGVCVGMAISRTGFTGSDDLLRDASLALHIAKREGQGHCHLHAVEDNNSRQQRDALAIDLAKALAAGDLRLHFQPFLNIATNEIVGFEALLRWTHPVRGAVAPPEIISIAEERGLIDALGLWVLDEACKTAATWRAPLRVAVNISPMQLRSRALVSLVAKALREAGLAAWRLEIEVTENVLIDDHPLAQDVLRALSAAGVGLSLDDFGVGYSSLNYLRRLPFDRLKIDRSFLSEATNDADAAAIIRAILGLARDLRLEVTAEGVETAEQLKFLRDNGCAEAQGYLIGRPMAPNAIVEYLDSLPRHDAA